MTRTLIVDNYDSFTFNLYQYLYELSGQEPYVIYNDQLTVDAIQALDFDRIVISPGPGRPDITRDFGICKQLLRMHNVPILGICLGHQGICSEFGGNVFHAPEVMHGRASLVYHHGRGLFAGIRNPISVIRYHSLCASIAPGGDLALEAWTDDQIVMAVRHTLRPIWGIQFHPESICSEAGKQLLHNFLDIPSDRQLSGGRYCPPAAGGKIEKENAEVTHPGSRGLNVRSIDTWRDPEAVFAAFYGTAVSAVWLDSSAAMEGFSRYSMMGDASGPKGFSVHYGVAKGQTTVSKGGHERVINQDIFAFIDEQLRSLGNLDHSYDFPFACGFVGYWGYGLKELGGVANHYQAEKPDAAFLFLDRAIVFDHQEQKIYLLCLSDVQDSRVAVEWFDASEALITALPTLPETTDPIRRQPQGFPLPPLYIAQSKERYLHNIEHALERIHDGESYEICLTNEWGYRGKVDPRAFYHHLRRVNPAPHGALMLFSDFALASSSPERFLVVDRHGYVTAKPMKGTVSRCGQDDGRAKLALLESEKERAENLMIVDLLRNDLGKVCEPGSIHVPKLMEVETFASVHQMISEVSGVLRKDRTLMDCVRAAFPGGSMTGAPKKRTMEIIESLEERSRGIYSGAHGYISLNGTMDFGMVIRSAVIDPCGLTFGMGGAITALSNLDQEFDETMVKAAGGLMALAQYATGTSLTPQQAKEWLIEYAVADSGGDAMKNPQEVGAVLCEGKRGDSYDPM